MADIQLRYLTDLDSATSVVASDLLHLNKGGEDMSLTIEVLIRSMLASAYPIGKVVFFATTANPNTLFPGTKWSRVPGAGRTIRLSSDDNSDILVTGGADEVTLSTDNLPSHRHYISLTTQQYNHGNIATTEQGYHTHTATCGTAGNHNHQGGMNAPGAQWSTMGSGTDNTGQYKLGWTSVNGAHSHTVTVDSAGNHSHYVTIGAHTHDVTGNTQTTGNGSKFSVVNKYVKLAAWYRTE